MTSRSTVASMAWATAEWSGFGRVEVDEQGAGVDDDVGHGVAFPEARQQFVGVPSDWLAACK